MVESCACVVELFEYSIEIALMCCRMAAVVGTYYSTAHTSSHLGQSFPGGGSAHRGEGGGKHRDRPGRDRPRGRTARRGALHRLAAARPSTSQVAAVVGGFGRCLAPVPSPPRSARAGLDRKAHHEMRPKLATSSRTQGWAKFNACTASLSLNFSLFASFYLYRLVWP